MKQIEIKEKRKAREKHFLQENGEIIAHVYDEDIHYFKDGKYEEIDNTITNKNSRYCNKKNKFKTYFDKAMDSLFELEKDNKNLRIKLKNSNEVEPKIKNSKSKLFSKITYKNILSNVDIEYELMPQKLKENIILKNIKAIDNKFVFNIETNYKLKLLNNRTIQVYDDNKTQFIMEAPFMVDSNKEVNNNIYYEFRKTEKYYELELILDQEWLNNKNTKFPVIIDPTITNQGNDNSVYDTYIYIGDTNVTRYNEDILKVGVEKINGVNRINRALLKFDLPTIGTGSQIIDAKLNLIGYPMYGGSSDHKIVNVHQITSDWSEENANWNNMNDKYNHKVENCFFSLRSANNAENEVTAALCMCPITNLVKKWYSDTPNYGVMLKLNDEIYTNDILPSFFSKNNDITGGNPKPILTVTYRNQNGLESYMKYHTQNLSRGDIHQNLYNGNLTAVFDIGATIEGKLPASINIVYNTNDVVLNNDIGCGLGYRFSFYQTIKETTIDDVNYLEYTDSDGTIHYFKESDSKYYDEDGLNLTITKNNTNYVMVDKEGNQTKFIIRNNTGYLEEYVDVSNNKITVIYDSNNRISKVLDGNNNEINIIYENNKISVVSPDETVVLNYLNNKLVNITSITGITQISYSDVDLISSITDENGLKYSYDYYEQKPYRIKKITQYGTDNTKGYTFDVMYDFNNTKIVDNKNMAKVITFNSYGNAVSIIDLSNTNSIKNAYGQKEVYGNNAHSKNKLLSSVVPEKHIKNYLSNTSFEDENIIFTSNNATMEISDEYNYSGFNSLKLVNENQNDEVIYYVNVPKGNFYTFSGFIKNTNDIKLILEYEDENTNHIKSESRLIKPNDSFWREEVTIYYPESAISNLIIKIALVTTGTMYIDDIQLEEGEVANNYNYIENSDFSNGLEGWDIQAFTVQGHEEVDATNKFEVVNVENNLNALKINMNPSFSTACEKIFKINGIAGEIYTISFWYKNKGVQPSNSFGNNYVCLYFDYGEDFEHGGEAWFEELNSDCEEWQYCMASFVSEANFDSIRLTFDQWFNANEMYITNIGVYKDLIYVNYQYDENGNLISVKGLNNENDSFNYDKNNQLIKMTAPMGKNFTFEYDNVVTDRVINGISVTGIRNEYIYDENGNPVTSKITNYKQNQDIVNGLYRIRAKGTNKYLKNINNYIKLEEDCGHNKWCIEKISDYYRIRHSIINDKYITYEDDKIVLSNNIDDSSLFTLIKNDNGSYLIKTKQEEKYIEYKDILNASELEEENPNFEFYFEDDSYEKFIESSAEYTEDGRFIKKTINNCLNEVIYDVDEENGLVKSVTNPNNITAYYTHNDKKQVVKVKCKDKEVSYSYNNQNLLQKIILENKEYNFIYDNFLNRKSVKIGDNITLITNNYEENNGNLLSSTYGNGNTISFSYDDFNRVKTITKMNDTYNYKYGNNGDLLKVISQDNISNFVYDKAKRIHEYRFNDFRIRYNYNKNNNIENKIYNLNNINYSISNEFNKDDSITKITFDDNYINYNYDELGRITNKNINNIINTNYDYVTNGNRTTLLVKSIDNNGDIYGYKYDKLDNITHIYNNDELRNEYFYDDYNQLIKENDYKNNKSIKYNYDNSGNIISKKIYKLNDYNLLSENKYEYNNSNWKDQLTKFNDEEITYDQIGNPLTIGNKTLTWINGRELNTYSDGENVINYKYNKDGIRISKIVNGIETKYYLEGDNIIFEQAGNNVIYYIRDGENNLEGFKYNDSIYYYIKNIQNDIIAIMDDSYNIIATYEYDSWGNILKIKDNSNNEITDQNHIAHINPFRYRSYYFDKETNLYYLNSRYYNPLWCRFMNTDVYLSTGQGFLGYNMYAYCNNNAIKYADKNGTIGILGMIGLASITVITTAVTINNVAQTQKTKKEINNVQNKYKNVCPNAKASSNFSKILKTNAKKVKTETKNKSLSFKINYLFENFGKDKRFDLKESDDWKKDIYYDDHVMEPQDIGNYHFGYVASAMGFYKTVLVAGGGYYQLTNGDVKPELEWCLSNSFCDDPRDAYFVRLGVIAYHRDSN